jgi:DNA-binding transcriptional LysR family regulator
MSGSGGNVQLNLHRLWIFVRVIDCGGFSAAAESLYMSQPSVSNQIRQLEASAGVTLIDRSGAKVRPTAEGEVLLDYARRVFLLADEAAAAIEQVAGLTAGRLAVGGTTTVGTYLLPQLIATFRRAHPAIACDIVVGNAVQVTKQLVDGDIGLAVLAGRPRAAHLVTDVILEEKLVLVAPSDHDLVGRAVSAGDLRGQTFLLRERGSLTREQQEATLDRWDLSDSGHAEMWGPETLKQAVAAGLGITVISEHAVAQELTTGALAALDITVPLESRPIVVAHRRDRLLSPAERAFRDLLHDTAGWPGNRA